MILVVLLHLMIMLSSPNWTWIWYLCKQRSSSGSKIKNYLTVDDPESPEVSPLVSPAVEGSSISQKATQVMEPEVPANQASASAAQASTIEPEIQMTPQASEDVSLINIDGVVKSVTTAIQETTTMEETTEGQVGDKLSVENPSSPPLASLSSRSMPEVPLVSVPTPNLMIEEEIPAEFIEQSNEFPYVTNILMTEEQEVAANKVANEVLLKVVHNLMEEAASKVLAEPDSPFKPSVKPILTDKPSSSTQLTDEQAVGTAGKELAVLSPNSPELDVDLDRTLPDILEGLSYMSGTITNIPTTQRVQGIDADLFKDKVMKQLTGITKNINDLFSSLASAQKAETNSSTKVFALS